MSLELPGIAQPDATLPNPSQDVAALQLTRTCDGDRCFESTTYAADDLASLSAYVPKDYNAAIAIIASSTSTEGVYALQPNEDNPDRNSVTLKSDPAVTLAANTHAKSLGIKPTLALVLPRETPPPAPPHLEKNENARSLWTRQHAILTVSRMVVIGVSSYTCLLMAQSVGHPIQATALAMTGLFMLQDALFYQAGNKVELWQSRHGFLPNKTSPAATIYETMAKTAVYAAAVLTVGRIIRDQFGQSGPLIYEAPLLLGNAALSTVVGAGWLSFAKEMNNRDLNAKQFARYKRIGFLGFVAGSIATTAIESKLFLWGYAFRIGHAVTGFALSYYGMDASKFFSQVQALFIRFKGACRFNEVSATPAPKYPLD